MSVIRNIILLTAIALGLGWSCSRASNGANPLSAGSQASVTTPTPTSIETATNTPTASATPAPSQVSVSAVINYPIAAQTGMTWYLVDPSGNTVASATTANPNHFVNFVPSVYGVYHAVLPAQYVYGYSSTAVNVTALGQYSVTFSSLPSLSVNPSTSSFTSTLGVTIPLTVTYSQTGNLNVPLVVSPNNFSSAFNVSPASVTLAGNGSSAAMTVTHSSCFGGNVTLGLNSTDTASNMVSATANLPMQLGYSIPTTITAVWGLGPQCGSNSNYYDLQFDFQDGGASCGATYVVSAPGGGYGPVSITSNSGYQTVYATSCENNSFVSYESISVGYMVTYPNGSTSSGSITAIGYSDALDNIIISYQPTSY